MMHIDISHCHMQEEPGPEVHLLVTLWLLLNTATQFCLTNVHY